MLSRLFQLLLLLAVSHVVSLLVTIDRLSACQLLLLTGLLVGVLLADALSDIVIYHLQYAAELALQPAALHGTTLSNISRSRAATRDLELGKKGSRSSSTSANGGLEGMLLCGPCPMEWNFFLVILLAVATLYSGRRTFAFAVQQQKQLAGLGEENALQSQFARCSLTAPEFAKEQ